MPGGADAVIERALECDDAGPAVTVACAYALEVEVEAVEEGRSEAVIGGALACEDHGAFRPLELETSRPPALRCCVPSRSRSRRLVSRCGVELTDGDLGGSLDWLLPILHVPNPRAASEIHRPTTGRA